MIDRRQILKLLPASMIAAAFPAGLSAAFAADRAPNLGLNLAGLAYWTSEHPFTNLATSASRWRLQRRDTPFTWDEPMPPLTEHGYPTMVPENSWLESFLITTPKRAHLPRLLTVVYDGEGWLGYEYGATLENRGKGRDVIRRMEGDGPVTARLFKTNPDNPLRNVRVLEQPDADRGQFRGAFLQRMEGMKAVRFMDWGETNNSKLVSWADRPKPGDFATEKGVSVETMIDLANTAGVVPWFAIPHLADDQYVRNFAELVRERLAPDRPFYVEYSNEVWNSIFEQANHARAEGLRLKLSDNEFEAQLRYYSQRTSEVLAIVEETFGDQRDRVLGVYAAQGENPWTSNVVLDWGDARKHADALAVAPYFGYGFGSAPLSAEVSGWSLDQLFAGLEEEVDGKNRAAMQEQVAVAQGFGISLIAYEAGQHLAGQQGAENDDRLTALFIAANRDPRMGALYRRYIENWQAAGGDLMVLYNSMGTPSKWGAWGLLDDESDTDSPKWDAVNRFLRA